MKIYYTKREHFHSYSVRLGSRAHVRVGLKKDGVYPTSAISNAILIAWMRDGKLRFLEDAPGETIPADVMLEVQPGQG